MNKQDRVHLFDNWAKNYDQSSTDSFPRAGYDHVLNEVARRAETHDSMTILDLGIGTGNLAMRFVELGCSVWGIDFSTEMLAKVLAKLPQVTLIQADLLDDWPPEMQRRFDRIVSAYVLHEFDLPTKVRILRQLADNYLVDDGLIVVGDVAFETARIREEAHRRWAKLWDEEEHYWAADEAIVACEQVGLQMSYTQVSSCGGVFVVVPSCQPKNMI